MGLYAGPGTSMQGPRMGMHRDPGQVCTGTWDGYAQGPRTSVCRDPGWVCAGIGGKYAQMPSQWDVGAWSREGRGGDAGLNAGPEGHRLSLLEEGQWAPGEQETGRWVSFLPGHRGEAQSGLRTGRQGSAGYGCSRGRRRRALVPVTLACGSGHEADTLTAACACGPAPSAAPRRTGWWQEPLDAARAAGKGCPPWAHSLGAAPPLAG